MNTTKLSQKISASTTWAVALSVAAFSMTSLSPMTQARTVIDLPAGTTLGWIAKRCAQAGGHVTSNDGVELKCKLPSGTVVTCNELALACSYRGAVPPKRSMFATNGSNGSASQGNVGNNSHPSDGGIVSHPIGGGIVSHPIGGGTCNCL